MRKVTVKRIITSRYGSSGSRPLAWDQRIAGTDTFETTNGETLPVTSTGQQSAPQPGWVIVVADADKSYAPTWTLFGLPIGASVSV